MAWLELEVLERHQPALEAFLATLGYDDVRVVARDGAAGWGEWQVWLGFDEDPARPAFLPALRFLRGLGYRVGELP